MKYIKKLIGERIYLSPMGASDEEIEKFTEWMNDFEITDYTARTSQITTYISEKEWLLNTAKDNKNINFNIVELKTDKLIGTISLLKLNHVNRNAELGIFIGDAKFRGNGYGEESINLILDYGFNYLNLHSIFLDVFSINERAHKCYLKCGFKDARYFRDSIFINGKYYDRLGMDILENEFNGNYIKNKNIK